MRKSKKNVASNATLVQSVKPRPHVYLDRDGNVTFEVDRILTQLDGDGREMFVVIVDTHSPRPRFWSPPEVNAAECFVLRCIVEGDFDAKNIKSKFDAATDDNKPMGVRSLSHDRVRRIVERLRQIVPIARRRCGTTCRWKT